MRSCAGPTAECYEPTATMPRKTETTPEASSAAPAAGYTVLARRYRSRDFAELIGQEPIARTLQNAIASGRTAHAYLFCGTRGVGKTSMARIFAKALNATPELAQAEEIGKAILRGDDLDVVEIDGASNRGINEARDLIANAGISPARCRYKIYIIDEVHMLTREAFNALLKTMEEPPAHVKFILCTTEANKVPATIQSRCQRFDFRPIPTSKIAEQLHAILREEKIGADDEVVIQVAQLGNGSMRDALSLLDRLLAAGEKKLTAELLEQMIGLPDHALIVSIADAFIQGDPKLAIERGDALLRTGATIEQSMDLLAEHLRTLMVLSACGEETPLLEMTAESKRVAASQAKEFDTAGLVHQIAVCDAVARNAKNSAAGRALFDAALVRMAMSERFADIARLLQDGAPAVDGKKKGVSGSPQPVGSPAPERVIPAQAGIQARGDTSRASEPDDDALPRAAIDAKPQAAAAGDDELWDRVLEHAASSPFARARVEHLVFRSFDGSTLRLGIEGGMRFIATQVDQLTEFVQRATGRRVRIELDAPSGASSPTAAVAPDVAALPAVKQAMEIFDAVVIDVQEGEPAAGVNA